MISLSQRRPQAPRPLDALLGDPATVDTAVRALAVTYPSAPWWPYAAAVGTGTVMVHVVGDRIPEPVHPWRAGDAPNVWTAERAAIYQPPTPGTYPVLIGYSAKAVVFVNVARAPGPFVVDGRRDEAAAVRELLEAQLPQGMVTAGEVDGACWPVSVRDGMISLAGLPIAFVLDREDALRATALLRAAYERPAEVVYQQPVEDERLPEFEHLPTDLSVTAWLTQIKEAAEAALEHRDPNETDPDGTGRSEPPYQ